MSTIIKSKFIFIVFLLSIFSGCGDTQRREVMMKDIQSNIVDLKKAQSESTVKIEELNNKVFLFQERLNNINKDIDEIKTMAIPVKPPDELKTVKLTPEEIVKQEPKKEELKKIEPAKEEQKSKEVKPAAQAKKEEKIPEPETLYRDAQEFYAGGKFEEAVNGFKRFIKYYPKNPLADNAQYWIGEVYYSNKDFAKAVVEFKKVVDNYPDENKAPDAFLKTGLSYMEMDEKNHAAETFKKLIDRYPKSDAAEKARVKLKEK